MEAEQKQQLEALLDGKNPAQKQAITATKGPVMIVAGAGSGKTTVLINRTANILNQGVSPTNLLLITFTNKAADDIKSRLREKVGEKADYVVVGTFHSVFKEHILKGYSEHQYFSDYGIDMSQMTILDDKDSAKIYKDAYEMMPSSVRDSVDAGSFTTSDMTTEISNLKAKGMDVGDFIKTIAQKDTKFIFKQATALLWKNYKDLCIDIDGLDFDDMLLVTNKLIMSDPKISIELAQKFKFIMIDEYQDTNGVQMSIMDSIAKHHNNICVVGDEKQSIYAFRGSDIRVILGFEKRYSNVTKINMAYNYRSQPNIITVGNAVADAMSERLTDGVLIAKSPIPANDVKLVKFGNDVAEANNIVKAIQRDLRNGVLGSEIAVIYRNKSLKIEIERQLVNSQVPYRLIGDTSFFQRAEVKDAISLLRFILHPWDSMAGLRVLGASNFGVSDKGARDAMKKEKLPVYQYLCEKSLGKIAGGKPSAVAKKSSAFLKVIDCIKRMHDLNCKPEILQELITDAWDTFLRPKLVNAAKRSADKEAASNMDGKIENVHQVFLQFSESYAKCGDVDKVIDDLILRVDAVPELDSERNTKVQLMTIHSSKGLEFENVYLIGMDKQTIPSADFKDLPKEEIEESRRLVYTGITRAKSQLVMSYAQKRMQHGQTIVTDMSPYMEEITQRTNIVKEINVDSEYKNDKKFSYSR